MSANASERLHGQRFSYLYLRSAELLQDSPRARRRVAALLYSFKDFEGLPGYLVGELGIEVIWGMATIDWPSTLKNYALPDFLDLFTVACRFLDNKRRSGRGMYKASAKEDFIREVTRIFTEENLRYEIDPYGGVHFKVDSEFAATTNAAIAALGAPRYANARVEFDGAMAALSTANVDGKQGIRGVFNSVECVYKLMSPRAAKLASADAVGSLQQMAQRLYSGNPTALRAANKSINAFGDWIDACHNYRHEEGVEEPSQPPIDLAVQLISIGSGFLRWLINIDQRTKDA